MVFVRSAHVSPNTANTLKGKGKSHLPQNLKPQSQTGPAAGEPSSQRQRQRQRDTEKEILIRSTKWQQLLRGDY